MSEKRVSGEALSQKRFEEEIRKHRDNALEWVMQTFKLDREEASFPCHAIQVFVNREVLGVVAKTEAERTKKLQELYDKTKIPDYAPACDHCRKRAEENYFILRKELFAFLGEGSSQESSQQQEQKP